MRNIYSALDIGSDTVKLVIGEFTKDKLNILCALKEETHGFKHNTVTDQNELAKVINDLLEQAESKLNFRPSKVILNIPADYNDFILTENTIDIESEDQKVSSEDILKVLKNSSINQIKPNEELISVIPIKFKVGDNETDEPFGKTGKKLSLKSILITTEKRKVYDFIKTIEKCGISIIDITTTGLVDYYNFETDKMNNKNVGIINLGNTSTTVSIFSKGIYINNEVLECGGYDIDRDIALAFNLRKKESHYLKENLALASNYNASLKETLVVQNKLDENIEINQADLSDIVAKRLEEILKLTKKTINHLTKKEISYIIITGGLSEMKDISIPLNKIYGKNVELGNINIIGARDNAYSVALGMLHVFHKKLQLRNKEYSTLSEDEIELMCNNGIKGVSSDSILGKVFGYFFDN